VEKLISKSFERLIEKGLNRGFITYEELQKSLGKRNANVESLEKSVLHIFDQAITFVKKKSDFKVKKQKQKLLNNREIRKEAMIPFVCIYEKWAELNYCPEKERSQSQKELNLENM
jgi:Sigma-70 factor, region 1.